MAGPATSFADRLFSLTEVAIKRLVTAIVVLPLLVLFLLKAGPGLFACFMAICSIMGLHEYLAMVLPPERRGLVRVASVAGGLIPLAAFLRLPFALPAVITLLFLGTTIHILLRPDDIKRAAEEAALTVAGYLYVPLLLSHVLLLRLLPHGLAWVFLMLIIVMMSDTFAYYLGCRFGRHKLYPLVSPNKSIEGSAGGLLGALTGAMVCHFTFFPELTLLDSLVTALAGGAVAQMGDLFESLLKRSSGVKDSGSIIPGHGGMLDRLDSILFAAPLIYYYALLVFYGRVGF